MSPLSHYWVVVGIQIKQLNIHHSADGPQWMFNNHDIYKVVYNADAMYTIQLHIHILERLIS